ncbi:MAG: hypothetical protein LAO05_15870 [Acidobacteriia bacterium]|nr:hypothetical protein [Terriglobia bacterium]
MTQGQSARTSRPLVRVLVPLLCLVGNLFAYAVRAQLLTSEQGNIWITASSPGSRVQLTRTGRDRDPSLSSDHSLVVFVRGTPGKNVDGPVGEAEATELWLVHADGREPRLLVSGGTHEGSNGVPVADFRSPQFSPDGAQVYFLSIAAVVSGAVYTVDLKGQRLREVCAANSLRVVRQGTYAGDLIVQQHRYYLGGGSYDWVFLVKPDGSEIGTLGDGDDPQLESRVREVLEWRTR